MVVEGWVIRGVFFLTLHVMETCISWGPRHSFTLLIEVDQRTPIQCKYQFLFFEAFNFQLGRYRGVYHLTHGTDKLLWPESVSVQALYLYDCCNVLSYDWLTLPSLRRHANLEARSSHSLVVAWAQQCCEHAFVRPFVGYGRWAPWAFYVQEQEHPTYSEQLDIHILFCIIYDVLRV